MGLAPNKLVGNTQELAYTTLPTPSAHRTVLLENLSVGLAPDTLVGNTQELAPHDFLIRPLALDSSGKIAGEVRNMHKLTPCKFLAKPSSLSSHLSWIPLKTLQMRSMCPSS